eukprot:3166314-Prymnesium_polylepis.1
MAVATVVSPMTSPLPRTRRRLCRYWPAKTPVLGGKEPASLKRARGTVPDPEEKPKNPKRAGKHRGSRA